MGILDNLFDFLGEILFLVDLGVSLRLIGKLLLGLLNKIAQTFHRVLNLLDHIVILITQHTRLFEQL